VDDPGASRAKSKIGNSSMLDWKKKKKRIKPVALGQLRGGKEKRKHVAKKKT